MYALNFGNCFILIYFHRCTILEPGPVVTPILQKSEVWGESIDNSTADQKTQGLLNTQREMLHKANRLGLEPSKIAAVVKEIILGENTNFRCQTNDDFLAGEIASKLKDPASNEPIDLIEKRLYGERKHKNK